MGASSDMARHRPSIPLCTKVGYVWKYSRCQLTGKVYFVPPIRSSKPGVFSGVLDVAADVGGLMLHSQVLSPTHTGILGERHEIKQRARREAVRTLVGNSRTRTEYGWPFVEGQLDHPFKSNATSCSIIREKTVRDRRLTRVVVPWHQTEGWGRKKAEVTGVKGS